MFDALLVVAFVYFFHQWGPQHVELTDKRDNEAQWRYGPEGICDCKCPPEEADTISNDSIRWS